MKIKHYTGFDTLHYAMVLITNTNTIFCCFFPSNTLLYNTPNKQKQINIQAYTSNFHYFSTLYKKNVNKHCTITKPAKNKKNAQKAKNNNNKKTATDLDKHRYNNNNNTSHHVQYKRDQPTTNITPTYFHIYMDVCMYVKMHVQEST